MQRNLEFILKDVSILLYTVRRLNRGKNKPAETAWKPCHYPCKGEMKMKYLCLGYLVPEKMDARPKAEIDAVMSECQPHLEELYKSGQVIIDAGLASETKCLRRVNGKVMVIDGPFVETKEMVGSALLIEARDMEEAIRVASLHPATQLDAGEQFGWGLEIRPIHYFEKIEQKV
jgi:hypothetical protein